MNKPIERLIALAGKRASVSIIRARDQRGKGVIRNGTLTLLVQPDEVGAIVDASLEDPFAVIVDSEGLPIVTLIGTDTFSMFASGLVSAEFRSSFRVDILDRPFPQPALILDEPYTYDRACRDLAAELEAGLRTMLLFRPDPEPEAALRTRLGVPPTPTTPLTDNSIRFAVGHVACTIVPDGDGIRITCVLSDVKPAWQRVHLFTPRTGGWYALEPAAIERCGADIRSFLFSNFDRFVATEQSDGQPPPPEFPEIQV